MTIEALRLEPDGPFPNNPKLPLLVYRDTVAVDGGDPAATFEELFTRNGWTGTWRNGVYPFHHYHSNAHEVLGIAVGSARIQFGGPSGPIVEVRAGDVALLPAGTAHKRIAASADLLVVGAYPEGQDDYDLMRGDGNEVERARKTIASVGLPATDPVAGSGGPVAEHWTAIS